MPTPASFIVGAPRSGTTLLRLMLDAHSQLAIPPETGFLTAVARPAWRCAFGRSASRLHACLTGAVTWPDYHLDPEDFRRSLARLEPYTLAGGVRAFYALYAARFGKARWGDKTPGYGPYLGRIERLLPEARFVHIIRDGRDCALSLRPLWFAPSRELDHLARDWSAHVRATRAAGQGVAHYVEVRYEQLVSDPDATLRSLCAFLDLPFEPGMLAYHARAAARLDEHEERRRADGSLVVSKAERRSQQARTLAPPDDSRTGRWRREMSADEVAAFQRASRGLLGELGYPQV